MPRLPGPEALGQLPSMRPTGSPATISGENPIAQGLGRVGQGMVTLANDQRERRDALEASEADAHLTTRLQELRRQFDTDPDHSTFEPRFRAEAERIRAEASSLITSPNLLRRWAPRADVSVAGALDHVLRRQTTLRGEDEYDRLERVLSGLTSSYVAATDDNTRSTLMRSIEDTLEVGRRSGIVSPERLRALRQRHLQGTLESDVDARYLAGDGYAALLELREGDARANQTSTGQVSDLGLSQIQRLMDRVDPPPPGRTAQQQQAALRTLRTRASQLSQWITRNVVDAEGNPIVLTQLQHDALVGFALTRRGQGASPQDALAELLPSIQAGNWPSVASAIRAGSLTALEQPAPPSTPVRPPPTTAPGAPPSTTAPDDMTRYMRAISSIESGSPDGNYGLVGPRHPTLGRALGRYQVMEGNLAAWLREAGQPQMTPEEFLANPEAQDAVFRHRFGQYVQRFGNPVDAAQAWFAGPGSVGAGGAQGRRDSLGTTVAEYRRRFQASLGTPQSGGGGQPGTPSTPSPSSPPGAPGTPAPAPAVDPLNDEIGDMVVGQAPAQRYAGIPLDRRRALIRRLSESLRTETIDGLGRDIDSIRQTGEPVRLPDGTTWLDRARHTLTGMQLAQYTQRIRQARAYFQAINGLHDATRDEQDDRLEGISSIGNPEEGTTPELRRSVTRFIRQIRELRSSDPALWASGAYIAGERSSVRPGADGQLVTVPAEEDLRVEPAREVVAAYELLARRYAHLGLQVRGGELVISDPTSPLGDATPQRFLLTDPRLTPEDRRLIIEARVQAMARVGIAEGDRHILRADEAARLLNLPTNLTGMTPDQFNRRLREAADRATELFGSRYARAAFDAALHFRRLTGERLRAGTAASEDMTRRLQALSREEALWGSGGFGTITSPTTVDRSPTVTGTFGGVSGGTPDPGGGYTILPGQALPGHVALTAPPGLFESSQMTGIPGWGQVPSHSVQGGPSPTQQPLPLRPSAPISGATGGTRATGVPGVSAQAWPRPSREDVALLLQNPQRRQAEFDSTFGPGTAALYLSQLRQ